MRGVLGMKCVCSFEGKEKENKKREIEGNVGNIEVNKKQRRSKNKNKKERRRCGLNLRKEMIEDKEEKERLRREGEEGRKGRGAAAAA